MLTWDLPPHARTVHRSIAMAAGTVNTTIYTVPAGGTLYITHAYVIGIADAGLAGIGALSEDLGATDNIILMIGAAGNTRTVQMYFRGGPLRIQSGNVVASTLVMAQPVTMGFSGWIENWNH